MTHPYRLNIAIFGIGAMGTLFGSKLNDTVNVSLFGNWPAQIEAVRREGVRITHPDGSVDTHRLRITNKLESIPPADIALILVKSHQTARAARQAAKILKPNGIAVTLQNGLGNLETLTEAVGRRRAALGITAQGATMLGPGQLRHAGNGPTHLALLPGKEKQLQQLVNLFNGAGLETTLVANADSLVWGKLAINAGINPLTALLEITNGSLGQDSNLRQMMFAAANEVAHVAAAQGIKLPFADAAHRTLEVSQSTAGNKSSMLQDVSRATLTEIDAISGAVVQYGQRFGVPTPVNAWLLQMIQTKEKQYQLRGSTLSPV